MIEKELEPRFGLNASDHSGSSSNFVERQSGLIKQTVGPRAARLTGRVESHTGFTDPHNKRAGTGCQHDSGVADPRSGFQHDTGESANRNVRAHTILVHNDESAVEPAHSKELLPLTFPLIMMHTSNPYIRRIR